jgi:amino acid adenylation domain-containing protein
LESGSSLFESLLVFENYPVDASLREEVHRQTGLLLEELHTIEKTNYSLALVVFPGEELTFKVDYDDAKIDAETIKRLGEHIKRLLEGIASARPEQPLKDLVLLTNTERERLLIEWNKSHQDYPQNVCLHEVLESLAGHIPNHVAVVRKGEKLTYGELNARANQLARHLQRLGVGPEIKVGICVERSPQIVIGLLGILKAGGAYVPLDPLYPQERLRMMLEDAGISILLTQVSLTEKFTGYELQLICLDKDWDTIALESAANLHSPAIADNLAYVIYTSGSTGRPKGVQITHRSLVNLTTWFKTAYGVNESDRSTQLASIGFDASVWELWGFLANKATVFIVEDETRLAPEKLRDWLVANEITISFAPTPLAEKLLALDWPDNIALRSLLTGGDKLHSYPAPSLPFNLINNYGPTEVTAIATYGVVLPTTSTNGHSPSIGRAINNTQLYVVDRELQPVPIGVPGELHLGGDAVGRGYLNRPDLTAEKFIPNPFSVDAGARLYRTGDLVRYLPSGDIDFLGRTDHQVKIRGYRIEPGEIEFILLSHLDVIEAIVVTLNEKNGDQRLAAYIVARQGVALNISQLRNYLGEKLPQYMVPSAFVLLDELPLTPHGKVDRKALPVPAVSSAAAQPGSAPRTAVEQMLAEVWCKILGLETVGIHDNFFDLGGHSLLATQLLSRLNQLFHLDLPLRILFESPTIHSLARRFSAALGSANQLASLPRLSRRPDEQLPPLSFAQQRLWFLQQLHPESAAYNIPLALRMKGHLNISALQASLDEVVRRHEVLRTVFAEREGGTVQLIKDQETLSIPLTDFKGMGNDEREAEVKRLAIVEGQQPFDLRRGPLLRVKLLRLEDTEHVVLITMHHIISDGWSMSVLVQEITTLYSAFSRDEVPTLEELPIQYADYASWQKRNVTAEILERQLGYWKRQLGRNPAVLELPTDFARAAGTTQRGSFQTFKLPSELSAKLKSISREHDVTLFMLLLAAFKVLLFRHSKQEDISIGSVVAGRNQLETERLIGFFVNTLVLRTDLSGNVRFTELLKRVREVCLGAYAHQEMPFEKLVEELQPQRRLNRTPLFQVAFGLDNVPKRTLDVPGLTISVMDLERSAVSFDLTLWMYETDEGLSGVWSYSTDLFNNSTITRLTQHFENLLLSIAAHPETRISFLEMLTKEEKQRELEERSRWEAENTRTLTIKRRVINSPTEMSL